MTPATIVSTPLHRALAGARVATFTLPSREPPGVTYWLLGAARPPAEPMLEAFDNTVPRILCRPGEAWPDLTFYPHRIGIAAAVQALEAGGTAWLVFTRQRDALKARARIERLR